MHTNIRIERPQALPAASHSVLRFFSPFALAKGLVLGISAIRRWRDRSGQRHRLLQLDDRMLRDIGLSRGDVEREYVKPFWKS